MQRPDPYFLKRHCDYPSTQNKSLLHIKRVSPERISTEMEKRINLILPKIKPSSKEQLNFKSRKKIFYEEPKSHSFISKKKVDTSFIRNLSNNKVVSAKLGKTEMGETSLLLNHSFLGDKIKKVLRKNHDYDHTPHFLKELEEEINYIDDSARLMTDSYSKQESPLVYQRKVDFKNSVYVLKVKDFQNELVISLRDTSYGKEYQLRLSQDQAETVKEKYKSDYSRIVRDLKLEKDKLIFIGVKKPTELNVHNRPRNIEMKLPTSTNSKTSVLTPISENINALSSKQTSVKNEIIYNYGNNLQDIEEDIVITKTTKPDISEEDLYPEDFEEFIPESIEK